MLCDSERSPVAVVGVFGGARRAAVPEHRLQPPRHLGLATGLAHLVELELEQHPVRQLGNRQHRPEAALRLTPKRRRLPA